MEKVGEKQDQNCATILDTLAQLGTGCDYQAVTEVRKSLLKRARAKYLTNRIIFPLIDLNSCLNSSYWRSYRCASVLIQEGQKLTSHYCNNRWCSVCNRIRIAKLINGYLPGLQSLDDPYFLTLTIPNVLGEQLKASIDRMLIDWSKIKNCYRKRGGKLTGIRKLETTYNSERGDYHPHFHLIIDGKSRAEGVLADWLDRYPLANISGQDLRPADRRSLKELFKYFTKLVCKDRKIYPFALDLIFQSMYGRRVYQNFGDLKKEVSEKEVSEDVDEIVGQIIEDIEYSEFKTWLWDDDLTDWLDMETGVLLTGYSPDDKIKELAGNIQGGTMPGKP